MSDYFAEPTRCQNPLMKIGWEDGKNQRIGDFAVRLCLKLHTEESHCHDCTHMS